MPVLYSASATNLAVPVEAVLGAIKAKNFMDVSTPEVPEHSD